MILLKNLIGIVLLVVAGLGVVGAVAANAPAAPLSVSCGLDPVCQAREGTIQAIQSIFAPLLLPAIVFLVALFVLPKFGWRGAVVSLIVIGGLVVWYLGVPPYLPPLSKGRLF